MPGRSVPLVNEEYYHVYNRGTNKKPIFWQKRDYQRFIELLRFYSYTNHLLRYSKFLLLANENRQNIWQLMAKENDKSVHIIAFCLMPNHFHILLKQVTANGISKFMGNIQNGYTRYANTKYDGVGPFLQGQFKAVHISDNYQLVHVSRYIHLNPYTGFVVKDFQALCSYAWSSLPEYIERARTSFYHKEVIQSQFTSSSDYKQFVFDQARYQRELDHIKHLLLEDE
jgi:putative transposase